MLTVEYVAKVTCSCGNAVEMPAKIRYRDNDTMTSEYPDFDFDLPAGWTWRTCPQCLAKTLEPA